MKRVVAAMLAAGGFLASTDSHAIELGTPATEHPFRSPQHFAFELRFSPYTPSVDDDPALKSAPFAKNFGDKPRLSAGLELDWQTYRIPHLGTIGPGLGVAYTTFSRNVTTVSGRDSSDTTTLSIYPFTAMAVLRADVFWRELGFPLVPYGKAGVGVALWRASNSGGTAQADGINGKGSSWGTTFSLGVALALDALDKGASQNMDLATGINNTYFFFEGYFLTLNGIAQDHALHVGSNTWAMGLAFEF